jgi:hypothetical protein
MDLAHIAIIALTLIVFAYVCLSIFQHKAKA